MNVGDRVKVIKLTPDDGRDLRLGDIGRIIGTHYAGYWVEFKHFGGCRLMYKEQIERASEFPVITLCGSTKFKDEFLQMQKYFALKGYVVLSVSLFGHSGDSEVWDEGVKEILDQVHIQKINMADEVCIIDVDGYMGEGTIRELNHAKQTGKKISYYSELVKGGAAI